MGDLYTSTTVGIDWLPLARWLGKMKIALKELKINPARGEFQVVRYVLHRCDVRQMVKCAIIEAPAVYGKIAHLGATKDAWRAPNEFLAKHFPVPELANLGSFSKLRELDYPLEFGDQFGQEDLSNLHTLKLAVGTVSRYQLADLQPEERTKEINLAFPGSNLKKLFLRHGLCCNVRVSCSSLEYLDITEGQKNLVITKLECPNLQRIVYHKDCLYRARLDEAAKLALPVTVTHEQIYDKWI